MKYILLSLLITLSVPLAQAQGDSEEADSEESLDLFDGDVEETRNGWPQLSVSLGDMALSADGQFDVALPNGDRVRIIDLDRTYSLPLGVQRQSSGHHRRHHSPHGCA